MSGKETPGNRILLAAAGSLVIAAAVLGLADLLGFHIELSLLLIAKIIGGIVLLAVAACGAALIIAAIDGSRP